MELAKETFVDNLREGQPVADLFLISACKLAETRGGKPYLALKLLDNSGEVEAKLWDNAARFAPLVEVGLVMLVRGIVGSYREQVQVTVTSLEQVAKDSVDMSWFFPSSKRSFTEMKKELTRLISSFLDTGLKKLVQKLLSGQTKSDFCQAPAAKSMHHAYLGGLLEHSLSLARLADKLASHYPDIDRDLLVAGALLHDVAKTKEFSYNKLPFTYTDEGRLLGHLVMGAEMVRQAGREIEELAPERVNELAHLILSHHGRYEYGSPVLPMTSEALILNYLDEIDSKLNYIDSLREKQKEPGWSDYQRPLERYLYLHPLSAEESGSKQEQEENEFVKRQQSLFD